MEELFTGLLEGQFPYCTSKVINIWPETLLNQAPYTDWRVIYGPRVHIRLNMLTIYASLATKDGFSWIRH